MGAGLGTAKGTVRRDQHSITTQAEGGVTGERLTGMIEVNAQVVAGDSGGPLYNSDGKVIGMDTAASSPAQSTGFPRPDLEHCRSPGARGRQRRRQHHPWHAGLPRRAVLGPDLRPGQQQRGSRVGGVLLYPAADAGLMAGDTIKSVDGAAVTSGTQLHTLLGKYKPGQSVSRVVD